MSLQGPNKLHFLKNLDHLKISPSAKPMINYFLFYIQGYKIFLKTKNQTFSAVSLMMANSRKRLVFTF